MNSRKRSKIEDKEVLGSDGVVRMVKPRWNDQEDKFVVYEFMFGKQLVTPGMQFKVKNERTTFTFQCIVTNSSGSIWIECLTPEGFRSIRPEKITRLVGIKRSYVKKVKNV